MKVHRSSHYDEVQQFIDARWIAAPEACWRIFRFNLYRMYPSVERLQVHLPNQHQVSFYEHQTNSEIVNSDKKLEVNIKDRCNYVIKISPDNNRIFLSLNDQGYILSKEQFLLISLYFK